MINSNKVKKSHSIIDETRRSIVEYMLAVGNITGSEQYSEFAKSVYPSLDNKVLSEVARHMDCFSDWTESYFLNSIIDYLNLSDEEFIFFLEQYVNPNIRRYWWNEQEEKQEYVQNSDLVNRINQYLEHDGYKLTAKDKIGEKCFYKCISTRVGVQGSVKNIIFAAKYKPEIVFGDALNNDIEIIKNSDQCLVYDKPISQKGLLWSELVEWYANKNKAQGNHEKVFIERLCECLDTSFKKDGVKAGPETWMLQAYYDLKKELNIDPPALIPQVYLYYDPKTLNERGYKLFEHQKMDYLIIFSHCDRVVIEIDGKQHYADGDRASPKLYSEMVKAQREMSLLGYDVYRFGGYEFVGADQCEETKRIILENLRDFFRRLFYKYGII